MMKLKTSTQLVGRRVLKLASAALLASLLLSACGGGGSSAQLYVTAVVNGQNMGGDYGTGSSGVLTVTGGQYFELDASEPVVWTLYVGNSAVSGTGTTVQYGGAVVTLTAESDSRINVDTYGTGALSSPVSLTLVATSTYDSAQVATVDVLITN